MLGSITAPVHPLIQSAVWELGTVHQFLAALDERQIAQEQSVLLYGSAALQAQIQLQNAEHKLCEAREALLDALCILRQTEPWPLMQAMTTLCDLETAWESHLLRSVSPSLPQRPTP